ncbi:MAG: RagB/SusD family nutrient uptake outer membrane protein [Chitinophagaceae bacterium]|nr:RagB/SusD family nutrient uptake outer membrane protein [Chitinophagaceae bacterium]
MKNKLFRYTGTALVLAMVLASCAKKLDLVPQNDLTPEKVYATPAGYKGVLAKIYGGLSIGGNSGPAGNPDISGGLDEGSQIAFIRPFFNCQELPTEEAVCFWNDQTIKNYHSMSFNSADPFLKGMYVRPIWNITLINEYLRESTDEKLSSRNITGADAAEIKKTRAEIRFLRAFNYWVMMDIFGKSTFITESYGIAQTETPPEISRKELYKYIMGELKAVESEMTTAKTAEYGRVDQSANWALQARIYLNANVYNGTTSTAYYDSAIIYASKVINAGYSLNTTAVNGYSGYAQLFMADNDKRTNEMIWNITCDGLKTQGYGNTTFLVNCSSGDDKPTDYFKGAGGAGWKGYVATKALAAQFSDPTGATDKRAMFTTSKFGTSPAQIELPVLLNGSEVNFPDPASGLHVNKFRNIRSDNGEVSDVNNRTFADIDWPVFRLAEMYLIYAEAVLRGGNGSAANALTYINNIRTRAWGGSTAGNITAGQLTLQFILEERGRELYWEGHRRTDLIRYGLLTSGTYLWPWKGGLPSGTAVDSKYNLYPIPASARNSNPNLTQNPGF